MAAGPMEVTEICAGRHPVVLGRDAPRALDRKLGQEDYSAAFILGDENTLRHGLPELLAKVPRLREARTLLVPPGGAVVTGVPDPDWGERVVALVGARPDAAAAPTAVALLAFLHGRIAAYKIPKQLVVVASPDELPTSPTGKPLRRAARNHPALRSAPTG